MTLYDVIYFNNSEINIHHTAKEHNAFFGMNA